ncbi:hypothetical protein DMENIID0001_105780 [Sergentomyia squamirostris]
MENILWVFYFIVLLAATSCALQADGSPSPENSSESQDMMATTIMGDEQITIANQGNETAGGSTIYVTLPPQEKMSPDAVSGAPSVTSQMPSMSTADAASAAPEPSPSSAQPAATTKTPAKAPPSNEIPQQAEDKPMTASKNSHEKSQAMENAAAFPTASTLPILVGVVALTLLIHP